MKTTTIQITYELKQMLNRLKLYSRETYNDIIERLIEDYLELSEETKRNLKKSEEDIKEGRVYSLKEVKKELKLDV